MPAMRRVPAIARAFLRTALFRIAGICRFMAEMEEILMARGSSCWLAAQRFPIGGQIGPIPDEPISSRLTSRESNLSGVFPASAQVGCESTLFSQSARSKSAPPCLKSPETELVAIAQELLPAVQHDEACDNATARHARALLLRLRAEGHAVRRAREQQRACACQARLRERPHSGLSSRESQHGGESVAILRPVLIVQHSLI